MNKIKLIIAITLLLSSQDCTNKHSQNNGNEFVNNDENCLSLKQQVYEQVKNLELEKLKATNQGQPLYDEQSFIGDFGCNIDFKALFKEAHEEAKLMFNKTQSK